MPQQPPLGFTFAGVACGIKKTGAADLALTVSDRPCTAAAVFTQNKFPAAPVLYDRALVAENAAGLRGVAINAGCANACTGEAGLADAAEMAALAEAALSLPPRSCAVMSTGVIGPRLPLDKLAAGVRAAAGQLSASGWDAASRAIMTTDTKPKVAFRQVGGARLFGMCKGAGMIHPNMATMLSAIVTDAAVAPDVLAEMLRRAVDVSFNCISVDGDMSTNDTVLLLANGAAGAPDLRGFGNHEGLAAFASALTSLCTDLAQQIVRDGEGATKFITVRVEGAASDADARGAAKAVANSPLVKTAFYGGDANWGRILAAVGYSGAMVEPTRAELWVAGGSRGEVTSPLQLVSGGQPLPYAEAAATAIFAEREITVTVNLGLDMGQAIMWTCDLSHEYVDINGHYRT
ncbi:MAG: bifunctional glutamate N-acetyltransferase/amino-acid acetyltransferase ArgJ [Chloroflexi bacterium]|nr:bifunctional glutamate N-acetyltransferase/amino-acid acetyltransferase ArgJ [Chloroflexota bacterium]